VLSFVFGHQFAGGRTADGLAGVGAGFSVAASASQADTGLPSSAAAALIVSSTSGGTEIESFRTVMPPS
jgi:hypothetical protein